MTLVPADPTTGDWIAPRLAEFGSCFGAIVPQGFELYVRILHAVQVDQDRWIPWADVAARTGTEVGPLSAFWRVDGRSAYRDPAQEEPLEGNLPQHTFRALTESLAAESAWDSACVSAVWHGWGHLYSRSTFGFAWLDDGSPAPTPPPPPAVPYPAEVLDGPTLAMPGREYFTFACTLATADAPSRYDQWRTGDGAGWQSPQLLWPQDRSWCVATEVDYDSTLVGGSAQLVARILADPRFEAFEVDPADDVDFD